MVITQTKLALGGAHAVGDVAVGLARFDLEVAGQHGTGQGDDDLFAGLMQSVNDVGADVSAPTSDENCHVLAFPSNER